MLPPGGTGGGIDKALLPILGAFERPPLTTRHFLRQPSALIQESAIKAPQVSDSGKFFTRLSARSVWSISRSSAPSGSRCHSISFSNSASRFDNRSRSFLYSESILCKSSSDTKHLPLLLFIGRAFKRPRREDFFPMATTIRKEPKSLHLGPAIDSWGSIKRDLN